LLGVTAFNKGTTQGPDGRGLISRGFGESEPVNLQRLTVDHNVSRNISAKFGIGDPFSVTFVQFSSISIETTTQRFPSIFFSSIRDNIVTPLN
jgi:hypothetical protein